MTGNNEFARHSGAISLTTPESEPNPESESGGRCGGEDVAGITCNLTWVWDRRRQTWLEIIPKPFPEQSTGAGDYIAEGSSIRPSLLPTLRFVPDKVTKTKPLQKLLTPKVLLMRVIGVLHRNGRAPALYEREANTRELLVEETKTTSTQSLEETGELHTIVRGEAETEIEEMRARIEERAKAWADGMIIQVEERAEQLAERIISHAKERVTLHIASLLTRTEESADALAKNISSRAEERSSAHSNNKGNTNLSKEIVITKVAICITLAGSALAGWLLFDLLLTYLSTGIIWRAIGQVMVISVAGFLVYGALVYQFTRLGHLKRQSAHKRASLEELDAFALGRQVPPAVFLLPSYKEEEHVIEQALLSVALQEYPNRSVVLLIDDPPNPMSVIDKTCLAAARQLPERILQLLDGEAQRCREAYTQYLSRRSSGEADDLSQELELLASQYEQTAHWFQDMASSYKIGDHTDRLFVEKILRQRSYKYFKIAAKARISSDFRDRETIEREYGRLTSIFQVKLSYFERKRYVNCSHESNKAMNLNSYIELMGNSYREVHREDGMYLEPASYFDGMLYFPDAKYVITLDADSLLLSEYSLRLIHILEQPHNDRVAVIQTPYSAVPNPTSIVERIAGATTDIQHIIHQGFTHFNGTYWVGANAVLRKSALDDIRVVEFERGFPIAKFIQDRTIIEDTESTVDLIARGWHLSNYPERLSYSATPPDFGSLLIQRRRWANGGLIILPKLIKYLFRMPFNRNKVGEALTRTHYLASIAAVNFGLLFLIVYPFEAGFVSFLLPLATLPYFYLYGRDLVQIGYRGSDLLRVYALNLMLLPVNLGGVLKSLQQLILNRKVPFGRTPKVHGRTGVPVMYLVAVYGLLIISLSASAMDLLDARYPHAAFCLINSTFFGYVVIRFIGIRNALEDIMGINRVSRLKARLIYSLKINRINRWRTIYP